MEGCDGQRKEASSGDGLAAVMKIYQKGIIHSSILEGKRK
jgi:hypothetical protein